MGTYPSLCKMFLLKCFALILPLVSAKNLTQHVEHICIETGTMSHADTDDMVSGTLHGSLGTCDANELGYSHYNDWEKGAYDCYGGSDGWFLVKVRVGERDCYFNKWLDADGSGGHHA